MSVVLRYLFFILLFAFAAQNSFAARYALVIGNQNYEPYDPQFNILQPLNDPKNDAEAMSSVLKNLGFIVTTKIDLNQSAMENVFRSYFDSLPEESMSLVYFSGHGGRINDGRNFLVPVGRRYAGATEVKNYGVAVDVILENMATSKASINIALFDACRDPILVRRKKGDPLKVHGFSEIQADGVIVSYGAAPDQSAWESPGLISHYTEEVIAVFRDKPWLPIQLMFSEIAYNVYHKTQYLVNDGNAQSAQKPVYSFGLVAKDNICFEQPCRLNESSNYLHSVEAVTEIVTAQVGTLNKQVEKSINQCEVVSEYEPRQVYVRGGRYRMGDESDGGHSDEIPVHDVEVGDLCAGIHEITFAEWDRCVADGVCHKASDDGWGRDQRPVINVSYAGIQHYIIWLNQKVDEQGGRGNYRLPSESEWEYLARGRLTEHAPYTAYWWGNEIGHNRANCDGCGSKWDDKQTAPVGSFTANDYGLYDVHGNVWEFTEDCWNSSYRGAPADGSAWLSGTCSLRVIRGGSWSDVPAWVRSAARIWNLPDDRLSLIGFRLARTP